MCCIPNERKLIVDRNITDNQALQAPGLYKQFVVKEVKRVCRTKKVNEVAVLHALIQLLQTTTQLITGK